LLILPFFLSFGFFSWRFFFPARSFLRALRFRSRSLRRRCGAAARGQRATSRDGAPQRRLKEC
jgi:hypothetical protein